MTENKGKDMETLLDFFGFPLSLFQIGENLHVDVAPIKGADVGTQTEEMFGTLEHVRPVEYFAMARNKLRSVYLVPISELRRSCCESFKTKACAAIDSIDPNDLKFSSLTLTKVGD